MSNILNFSFSVKDPEFKSQTIVINPSEDNYLSHTFISTPIYDNFGIKIGYKVSDDYIQQLDVEEYSVRISSTYHIYGKGSISWNYVFINNIPSYYYPLGIPIASNIVSTTEQYFGKSGAVSLDVKENGTRNVTVVFNIV